MPKETMTPKERWLAVLRREKPDRLPTDYWATDEATAKLLRHLGCSDAWGMFRRLHIDKPVYVGPSGWGPPGDGGYDVFGCRWQSVQYATGAYLECVEHPLARFTTVAQLEAEYTWPSLDRLDFAGLPGQLQGREEYPVIGGGSEPFLTYCELRGREQAYKDLLVNRPFVEHCLDKLFDLAYAITRRIYETLPGRVTLSYVAEDFGSQEDLMVSPRIVREVFIPRMKRMVDLAHAAGAYVITHSDGAVRRIIPDFIAMGADVLNPIQWRCAGMEREGLKRDFGAQIVFHGGVDNQQTLAFGTVADVVPLTGNTPITGTRR